MHEVVAAALFRRGEVLLCHRSPTRRWYPDVWDLPGGHVEPNESPLAAFRRELLEEIGVVVPIENLGEAPDVRLSDADVDMSVWSITGWYGEPINKALIEHDDVRWFRIEEALRARLAHPGYPAMLRALADSLHAT